MTNGLFELLPEDVLTIVINNCHSYHDDRIVHALLFVCKHSLEAVRKLKLPARKVFITESLDEVMDKEVLYTYAESSRYVYECLSFLDYVCM